MGTNIRNEISHNNTYYITKDRYLELLHFVKQYPEWKHELVTIDGICSKSAGFEERINSGKTSNPTEIYAETRMYYADRIKMVEKAAFTATDEEFGRKLIFAITTGLGYGKIEARGLTRCGKEVWYAAYRKFFWILDKIRK